MSSPLFSYLPQMFSDLREFGVLFDVLNNDDANGVLDDAAANAAQWLKNQFPTSGKMDESGVRRWAQALRINTGGKSAEDLLFSIKTALTERRPYTVAQLRRMLDDLCGEGNYELLINVPEQAVTVRLSLTRASDFNAVSVLLDRILPAHLSLLVIVNYNRYGKYSDGLTTHADMHAKTHHQLRSDA